MIRIDLKTKLFIGFGFLFFLIVLLWIIGGFFIYDLSNRSAAMLKENYQTVESTKFLIQSIDEIKNQQIGYFFGGELLFDDSSFQSSRKEFDQHLIAVRNNVTEEGEEYLIEQLASNYHMFLSSFERLKTTLESDSTLFFRELVPLYTVTRNLVVDLWDMNMNAISHKNTLLKSTAHRAFVLMSVIGTICFIISALFVFRFPRDIARPIGELIRGITEIANRNYSKRLNFDSTDELGELAKAFNTMAAKLDEYEHSNLSEILFEKRRIDTIINNMKDAIIGLNDRNEIIFSNTYACKVIRLDESSLLGKYAPDVALGNPVFNTIIQDILEEKPNELKEFKPIRIVQDEEVRYFTRETLVVNITKTGESEPIRAGIVVVLKNITRFLEQDEAKTHFMATISHELKTPLSSLRLNLKLLDDSRVGSLNDEQQDIVRALKSETSKMLTITSELLDLAQLESGNIQLDLRPVPIAKIVEYIRETSDDHARTRQVSIDYSFDPGLPRIYADPEKTAWVLINLINNAIQYSDPGGRVIVSALQNGNEITFSVEDHGRGIETQYLELIFQKFFRAPNSEAKGTGLGLAISKELVSKQNGRIWAESIPGRGSIFHFSLPVAL